MLNDPFSISEVEDIASMIIPQIEAKFFGCFVHVQHIYIYRSIATKQEAHSSWLWHYDNYPAEVHKIIIYLTDVAKSSGPFRYLVSDKEGPLIIKPSRTGPSNWKKPKWKGSRIPEKYIKIYQQNNYYCKKVTGCIGTMILFDNNCIHKATVAKKAHRDVLVFQLKPSIKKLRPHINKAWTGSFQHIGLSKDPGQLKPTS